MLLRLRAVRTIRRRNRRISLVVDFAFQPQFANLTVSFADQKIAIPDMDPMITAGRSPQMHSAPVGHDITIAAEFFGEAVSSTPVRRATRFVAMLVTLRECSPVQQQ
jgi:hypothetical protein